MPEDRRVDPDLLLAEVHREEARHGRGKLKIFLGASPGVGKTYAMLEAARARLSEGADVVVGVVETHGRTETARLLEGLETLPRRAYPYRGTTLLEFDLDAALARHPAFLILDELAHTNAAGTRHAKRWQDVEELLAAGINVYTTLNIQHIESLNDVVARITGVTVRETVPDAVVDQADELELVDVSADVLLQRLREGKVYVPEQAARALDQFFRRGNLIALRELALRHTAERVDAQMRGYMRLEGIKDVWPIAERLLVGVGPNPGSARLVRATRRMAASLRAPWIALYVETPAHQRFTPEDRDTVAQNLQLAESLGATTATITGESVADEMLDYARQHNVSKIVVGKPARGSWLARRRPSLLDAIVARSGSMDVYVITGEGEASRPRPAVVPRRADAPGEFLGAIGIVALVTALMFPLRGHFTTIDIAMVYLLGVVFTAARFPQRPALVAAALSIVGFDLLFVPPYYTFDVSDTRYLLTFLVMLVVAVVMSRLTVRIRRQGDLARARERRTGELYAMTRELASAERDADLPAIAARHITTIMGLPVEIVLGDASGMLARTDTGLLADEKERTVATWVLQHGQMAGNGSATLPAARGLYFPLRSSRETLGVAALVPEGPRQFRDPDRRGLLEAFIAQAALAIERTRFSERSQRAQVEVEAERLRTSLLSSLSHDLRTPLAGIEGAATTLLGDAAVAGDLQRRDLTETIIEESRRMTRLVGNLLDMMRLETGSLSVQKEWQPLEEVIGVALLRTEQQMHEHPVVTDLPEMLLVPMDGLLMEQVFINLLENVARHTPAGTPVTIRARREPSAVVIEVMDRGPGIPASEEKVVFDEFRRSRDGTTAGLGLGLTICRGIVRAHGGTITAENAPGGGALFRITLPLEGAPPFEMPLEAAAE